LTSKFHSSSSISKLASVMIQDSDARFFTKFKDTNNSLTSSPQFAIIERPKRRERKHKHEPESSRMIPKYPNIRPKTDIFLQHPLIAGGGNSLQTKSKNVDVNHIFDSSRKRDNSSVFLPDESPKQKNQMIDICNVDFDVTSLHTPPTSPHISGFSTPELHQKLFCSLFSQSTTTFASPALKLFDLTSKVSEIDDTPPQEIQKRTNLTTKRLTSL